MTRPGRATATIVVAGSWVNASEFFRNQLLLRPRWLEHYRSLGLRFPDAPVNAAMWVVWGFLFAAAVFGLSRRFGPVRTTLLGWLMGFVLMWVVTWDLGVLPIGGLPAAVPLSLLETAVASLICARMAPVRGG